jgi:hypothetical protein
MTRISHISRTFGSLIFIAAGLFYVFASPNTTTEFFDAAWPAIAWGSVFIVGGFVSGYGTLIRIPQVERLGVFMVMVSALCLTAAQIMVMVSSPITWTRGGGTLVYLGFTAWVFDRWARLGEDEVAIHQIADRED